MEDTIERLDKTAHYLKNKINFIPEIAIVLDRKSVV